MQAFQSLSNSKYLDASVPDLGPTQIPPITVVDVEISEEDPARQETTETKKEDPQKTAETPTEVTNKSIDMAASGTNSSYTGRLKNEVEKNKNKIKKLQEQLEDHNQNCVGINKTLRDEIRKLTEENDVLKKKVQTLERKIDEQQKEQKKDKEEMNLREQWFEDKHDLEKKARRSMKTKYDAELKTLKDFTENQDVLCLRQLCVDVQVHMYMYVMREDYEELFLTPDIDKIEFNIVQEIKIPEKITRAKRRLQILKGKKFYKEALSCLGTLIKLKKNGNITAHPELDIEKIKQSIANLRKDNKLKDKRYEDVKKLATIWTESKSLLDRDDRDEDEH